MISRPRGICLLHVYVAIGWLHYQQSDYQRRSLSPTLEKHVGLPCHSLPVLISLRAGRLSPLILPHARETSVCTTVYSRSIVHLSCLLRSKRGQ
jgi:hypothetical protein